MNIWHDMNKNKIKPESFIAVIEISKGSKKKYELDKETGLLILDRVLYTSTHYPANYGFIPKTLSDDGDPLDVLVLCQEKIDPMVMVQSYPVGLIEMVDGDEVDEKIVAIPEGDPSLFGYRDIFNLPNHISNEIIHFFEVYKQLEHTVTSVSRVLGRESAIKAIEQSIEKYEAVFEKESM